MPAITIDASDSSSMNFEAFIRGGFIADAEGGGFPVFDNSTAFSGEEMLIGYGSDATSKYVLAHGSLEYFFGTHTVHGTINTIEYGTFGEGTYDSNGYFTGGNVALKITGLELFNAVSPEAEVEANGPVHNFAVAHMYGASADPDRLDVYADALDAYAQNYIGATGRDIYTGTQFADTINGGTGADRLTGGGGDDVIIGGVSADRLNGSGGNDRVIGGGANDVLTGGIGRDLLTGGTGADTFVYKAILDSTLGTSARDTVFDFDSTQGDLIDLSRIDANSALDDDQAFAFIGGAKFSGEAGELRYVFNGETLFVHGDIDGDKATDFIIALKGITSLSDTDFIL